MTRAPKLDPEFAPLRDLIEKVDPQDFVILALGGYLGYHGWTPLTGLINSLKGLAGPLTDIEFDLQDPLDWVKLSPGIGAGSPIPMFIQLLYGSPTPDSEITSPRAQETKEEWAEKIKKDQERRLKAAIGALEAYAMTRPGFISGIGEIVPL